MARPDSPVGKRSTIALEDFAGGLKEGDNLSAADFSERQWAQLKGFVLENEGTVRTQWGLQRVASATTDLAAVYPLVARQNTWLLGLTTTGSIVWAKAPADTAASSTTRQVTFTPLTGAPSDPDYRFLCAQPLTGEDDGHKTAIRIHCSTRTAPAVLVFENASGVLEFKAYTGAGALYPSQSNGTSINPNPVPAGGKAPAAACAAMWGDTLVLGGDIYWLKTGGTYDQALSLSASNTKLYPNGLWFANGGEPDKFRPSSVLTGAISADARVVDLVPVEDGMLVFTTTATGRDGVVLLRGEPANFSVEMLRGGLGIARRGAGDKGPRPISTTWAEAGLVVWVGAEGAIWQSNGSAVDRIDRVGPAKPDSGAVSDHAASIGPYLFVSRDGRLLCERMFADTASWTELVLPEGLTVRAMTACGGSLYLTDTAGRLWRFATQDAAVSERGLADGVPLRISAATSTQDAGEPHRTKLWGKVGVRAEGIHNAVLNRLTFRGDAWFSTAAHAEVVYNPTLPVSTRDSVTFDGLGSAVEASVGVEFTGDVRLESVTMWVRDGRALR